MIFKEYTSIENAYRSKFINDIIRRGLNAGNFLVLEKIHGSNYSYHVDDSLEVIKAKRSCFISNDTNFFNNQSVDKIMTDKVKLLFILVKEKYQNVSSISLFGELFGGNYPHPDVRKIANASTVQKGVYYHPDNKFLAYDLKISCGENIHFWVNYKEATELFWLASIPYIKILFEGSFEEALKHSNEFQTTIPNYYGLPPIENNICEGIVIKPEIETRVALDQRLIIKSKNEKFSEKATEPKVKIEILLDDASQAKLSELISLVSENRLRNIISKHGPFSSKDFGKILSLMMKDIFEEYLKDNTLEDIPQKHRDIISKILNSNIAELIRPNFLNVIDGTF